MSKIENTPEERRATLPDCGAGNAAFCKFHPGVCGGCRRASEDKAPSPRPAPPRFPMQPLVLDGGGVVRFRVNAIVRKLLDESQKRGYGLNELAVRDFPQEDWEQFYQLIGYSLCGYHELSQVSDATCKEATAAARLMLPKAGGCRDEGCPIHSGVENDPRSPPRDPS